MGVGTQGREVGRMTKKDGGSIGQGVWPVGIAINFT